MKKILFSLLLVLCCSIAGAQKKSEVLVELKETIYDYFLPDFNDAVEDSGWRNPRNADGLVNASRAYIEHNHFFRNGKVCSSYTDWVNQYCSQSLYNRIIEHSLTFSENLLKVSGNNDLYRIEATLSRRWVNMEGPAIPAEKINITFLWRGVGNLVHIMHLDGDMAPIELPEPVDVNASNQIPSSGGKADGHSPDYDDNLDNVSDGFTIGSIFKEFYRMAKEEGKLIFWLWFAITLSIAWRMTDDEPIEWGNIFYWIRLLLKAALFTTVWFILLMGCYIGFKLYEG